jgi:putative adhesin
MRAPSFVALLSFATLASAPAWAATATTTDHWERTYPISGRAVLHLVTDDGHVRVHDWDKHEIAVKITTQGWRIGERGVRIQESHEGGRVDLDVRTPHWNFNFGFVIRSLRIEVWVPNEADLTLETGDGDVGVPAVHGRVDVRTGDGAITVEGARGDIRLRSGDGRIVATGIDGVIDAHTGDGSLRVDGRLDGLTLGSGDGGIVAEVMPGSRVASGWSVSTGDGGVTLRVPTDLKADIEAHTGDGGIDIDLPLTISGRVSRQDVRGTLNGGGPLFRLRSGDGSIHLTGR